MYDAIGTLDIDFIATDETSFPEGSAVSFQIVYNAKTINIFKGTIVSRRFSGFVDKGVNFQGQMSITAYDLLWHLRPAARIIFSQKQTYTPAQVIEHIFNTVFKDGNLPYKISDDIKNINMALPTKNQAETKVYSLFKWIAAQVVYKTNGKKIPYLYDDSGVLTFDNVFSTAVDWKSSVADRAKSIKEKTTALNETLILGDNSLITNFSFESSVQDTGYNKIILWKENVKDEKQHEPVIVYDQASIDRLGLILYEERVDDNMTMPQMQQVANELLNSYKKPNIRMTLECIGHLFSQNKLLRAGSVISLDSEKFKKFFKFDWRQGFIVEDITHKFVYRKHTMNMSIRTFKTDNFSLGNF